MRQPDVSTSPRVALIALNAHFAHTNLAIRLLRNAALAGGLPPDRLLLCEWTINDLPQQLLQRLFALDADIYAFSCSIWNRNLAARLCRDLALIRPQATIVWGGPEASQDADQILVNVPAVQAIIAGEGETAFADLIANWTPDKPFGSNPAERPNLIWRHHTGQIIHNPAAPLLDPADWLFPYSDRELDTLKDRLLYFETSRGCPYGCTYCLSSLDRTVRLMPAEAVRAAFSRLIAAQVRQVKLVDRTFNIHADRSTAIWQALIADHRAQPFATNFHFEIMADRLKPDAIDLLATAPPGLIQFEIGVQTTTPHVLEAIRRPCDWPRLAQNVRDLHARSAIHLHLDLIAGLPGETLAEFTQAFNDVYQLDPHQLQLGFLKVLPGSPMADQAKTLGFAWSAEPPYEILASDKQSFADLALLKDIESMLDLYHNSGRFKRTLDLLRPLAATPFDFFKQLAQANRAAGWFDRQTSQITRVEFLLAFGRSIGAAVKGLQSTLKLDYLLSGAKDQPDCLDCLDASTDPDRMHLRQHGRDGVHRTFPRSGRFRLEDFVFDQPIDLPDWTGGIPAGRSLCAFDLSGSRPRLILVEPLRS